MRLPIKEDDDYSRQINQVTIDIKNTYINLIKSLLNIKTLKVMLSDGTVTDSETFDPDALISLNDNIRSLIKGWSYLDVEQSKSDYLRRLYFRYYKNINAYKITITLGIQFHALPYYKPDRRILEIKKDLYKLGKEEEQLGEEISKYGNDLIKTEIKRINANAEDDEELFRLFIEKEDLVNRIEKGIDKIEQATQLKSLKYRKENLLKELETFIIEHFRISLNLLDEMHIIQGDDGLMVNIDLEKFKNNANQLIEYVKIDREDRLKILTTLQEFANTLKTIINKEKSINDKSNI